MTVPIDYRLLYDYTRDGVNRGSMEYRKTLDGALTRAAALAAEHGTSVVVEARLDLAYPLAGPPGAWHRFVRVTPDGVVPLAGVDAVAAKVRQRADELAALAATLDAHYPPVAAEPVTGD